MRSIALFLALLSVLFITAQAQCTQTCGFGGYKTYPYVQACSELWKNEYIEFRNRTCCHLTWDVPACNPTIVLGKDFQSTLLAPHGVECMVKPGDITAHTCSADDVKKFQLKQSTLVICYDAGLPNPFPLGTDLVATRTHDICKMSVGLSALAIVLPVIAIFIFVGVFILTRMHIARKKTGRI